MSRNRAVSGRANAGADVAQQRVVAGERGSVSLATKARAAVGHDGDRRRDDVEGSRRKSDAPSSTHSNVRVIIASCRLSEVGGVPTLGTGELAGLVAAVGAISPAIDDHDRIERVGHFERLKFAIAAAQAAETAAFTASQRALQAAQGVPSERQNRGIASQIALARRVSVHSAQRYTGFAMILTRELPQTFAALRAGNASEWRATLLARETIFLSREDRALVDRQFAPRLASMSERAVETETRKAAYLLDPEGSLARTSRAAADRHVSICPAPDTMTRLSALTPVAQGVAVYASLVKAADSAKACGDSRSRGQIMADTLIERVTGQAAAASTSVEIELIINSDSLFAYPDSADTDSADTAGAATTGAATPPRADPSSAPGLITAPGLTPMPVPAGLARELVAHAATAWLRRLFVTPDTGELVAMESRRRLFSAAQRDFLRMRDQYCATPHCGAPIRHADHVIPAGRGGPTHIDSGRGQCQACNHATQAPGWRSRPLPDGSIETVTPTGHVYVRPPPRPFAPILTRNSRPSSPNGSRPSRVPGDSTLLRERAWRRQLGVLRFYSTASTIRLAA